MTLEEGLVVKLNGAGPVAAITTIVSPIFGRAATNPQDGTAPTQIVFALVSRPDLASVNAPNPWRQSTFDLVCVAATYPLAVALADAVETALNFQTTGYGSMVLISASVRNVSDGSYSDTGLFARTVQIEFGYNRQ